MNPLVGPIIGKVTDTTARILLEYENVVSVTVTLISQNEKSEQLIKTKTLQRRRPTIFKFENLQPYTKYMVIVSPFFNKLTSSFRTFKSDADEKNVKIAWVSCNDAHKNEGLQARNLWYFFAEEVMKDKYDLCCHIGDQIYLDSEYWNGSRDNVYSAAQTKIFTKYHKNEWIHHAEEVKELIRSEYRKAWTFAPTAIVLANVPNIMLADDHDIRDNWGFLEEDWNPNTQKCDYFYGKMCQAVYYEYQRQLWDDTLNLDDISNIKEEYFTLRIGQIGFYFMDIRGDRTWHRTEEFPQNKMLSTKQWNRFDIALKEEFTDVENLFLVSQSTIVFLNHTLNRVATLDLKDCQEQWIAHEDEQVKLLKRLYDWKFESGNKQREVTIICGDVHFGGHSDIYYNHKPAFKQFTSSSITNGVVEKYKRYVTTIGLATSEEIKDGFSFFHRGYTGKNNYGYTHVYNQQVQGDLKIKVDCTLIIANDKKFTQPNNQQEITIDNMNFSTFAKVVARTTCCHIF